MQFTLTNNTANNYRVRNLTDKKTYKIKKGGSARITTCGGSVSLRVYNPCFYNIISFLHILLHYFIFFIPWIIDLDMWRSLPGRCRFENLWACYRAECEAAEGETFLLNYDANTRDKRKSCFAQYSVIIHSSMGVCRIRNYNTADFIFELMMIFVQIGLYSGVILGIVNAVK